MFISTINLTEGVLVNKHQKLDKNSKKKALTIKLKAYKDCNLKVYTSKPSIDTNNNTANKKYNIISNKPYKDQTL